MAKQRKTVKVEELAERLQAQGYSVRLSQRSDGGYRITEINGKKYTNSKGNKKARELLGVSLSQKQQKQRERPENWGQLSRYKKQLTELYKSRGAKPEEIEKNFQKYKANKEKYERRKLTPGRELAWFKAQIDIERGIATSYQVNYMAKLLYNAANFDTTHQASKMLSYLLSHQKDVTIDTFNLIQKYFYEFEDNWGDFNELLENYASIPFFKGVLESKGTEAQETHWDTLRKQKYEKYFRDYRKFGNL